MNATGKPWHTFYDYWPDYYPDWDGTPSDYRSLGGQIDMAETLYNSEKVLGLKPHNSPAMRVQRANMATGYHSTFRVDKVVREMQPILSCISRKMSMRDVIDQAFERRAAEIKQKYEEGKRKDLITHCGFQLSPQKIIELLPTDSERLMGIERVIVREYYCAGPSCRKRLFFWQSREYLPFSRVHSSYIPALIGRLQKCSHQIMVAVQ